MLTLVGVAALVVPAKSSDADDFLDRIVEAAPGDGETVGGATTSAPAGDAPVVTDTAQPGSAAPTVAAWFGDSVALTLLFATTTYVDDGPVRFADLHTSIGCGVALSPPGEVDRCASERQLAMSRIPTSGASVGIVMSCQWELLPVPLPGSGSAVVRSPGDPEYDAYVRDAYVDAIDQLRAGGFERVLWVLCPHQSLDVGVGDLSQEFRDGRDPARMDRNNEIVRSIADERDDVTVVDLPSWVDPRVDDAVIRPDGSHYEWSTDTGVSAALAELVDQALQQPG